MRVLFSTPSHPVYMAPPMFGDEQVNCGLHWPDETDSSGRIVSLRTTPGEYDLAAVAARLPAEQQPDLVVCLVDSGWENRPRRLSAFKCPRVLLIADTHHLTSPLIGMLRYIAAEKFDRVVLLYDRHHAGFFRSAGFQNLYWFPGLTFPHRDDSVRAARNRGARAKRIAFVGQAGKYHPRRERLISELSARGLPIEVQALAQPQGLRYYGASLLGFNASLNGDLNLRVFEIIASGAALLTDRLQPESGLAQLLRDGRDLLVYGSPAELAERAVHAVAHPAETKAIGLSGQHWFDTHLGERRRSDAFRSLAFDGTAVPMFDFSPAEKTHVYFGGDTSRLLQSIIVYEGIQEAHRERESVRISMDSTVPADVEAIFETLPRVELQRAAAGGESDLAILGAAPDSAPSTGLIWLWETLRSDVEGLKANLNRIGFEQSNSDVALFSRLASAKPAIAGISPECCRPKDTLEAAKQALRADPADIAAISTIARLAFNGGNLKLAHDLVRLLSEIDPTNALVQKATRAARDENDATQGDAAAWRKFAEAFASVKDFKKAAEAWDVVCRKTPENPESWLGLGRALLRNKRAAEAMAASLHAAELSPGDWQKHLQAANAALAAEHWEVSCDEFEHVKRINPREVTAARGLSRARSAQAAWRHDDDGYDLIICHLEITRLHGTGVLLQRFFPNAGDNLITLRSNSLYEGKVEIGGRHWVIEGFGLSIAQREARMRRLLAPYKIRRILCVPYYATDFVHGYLAKKITGAPLCSYVMDDQAVYGGIAVPPEVVRWLFNRSDLRLAISPEMSRTYLERFGMPFGVLPPVLNSIAERAPNRWRPSSNETRCALVGNIWSARQFSQLRQLVREARLNVDWYGNAQVPWLPIDRAQIEIDGIHCRGFIPERDLADRIADYPFVLVPSGQLDGTETNEWLTRLSLPSRMVFIMAQTFTPMLVLGSPETAAAGYVRRLGVGLCARYDPLETQAAIRQLLDPATRAEMVANAQQVADSFVMPEAGEWIWRSLSAGEPEATDLTRLMLQSNSSDRMSSATQLAAAG